MNAKRLSLTGVLVALSATGLFAAEGRAAGPYPLSTGDRETLKEICGDAMPSDDALVDCAKGKTFIACGALRRDMLRYVTDPIQLEARLDHAITEARQCQEASSPHIPVSAFSWRHAHDKLKTAKHEFHTLKTEGVLEEMTPPYTAKGTGIHDETFEPENAHDVAGMHAFCKRQHAHLTAAKADPLRAKLSPYQKKAVASAEAEATSRLATCSAATQMLVAVADEAAADVTFVRRVLASVKNESGDHAAAVAHLADLVAHPRETIDVVAKDFIMEIGSDIGVLPGGMNNAQKIMLADLATLADKSFNENPQTPARDHRYRFYSHKSYSFSCDGDRIVGWGWRPPSVTMLQIEPDSPANAQGTDTGTEPAAGGLPAPPAEVMSDTMTPMHALPNPIDPSVKGLAYLDVSWRVKTRPNYLAKFALDAIRPRDSVYIWHKVSGRISCKAGKAESHFAISGSAFPTHALWVTHTTHGHAPRPPVTSTVRQGPFARLWESDPTDKTLVK